MAEDFEDLARLLRQEAGGEWRAEAAEDEELTERQRRRRRDLAESARQTMHRGDRVTATVGGISLTNPVVAVGDDYLVMENEDGWVDIRIADSVLTVVPQPEGGASGRPEAHTFRARIAEHEQERRMLEILTRNGDRWSGEIDVLGVDHVVLAAADGRRTYIPLQSIVVVFSRFPPRRLRGPHPLPQPPGPPGASG